MENTASVMISPALRVGRSFVQDMEHVLVENAPAMLNGQEKIAAVVKAKIDASHHTMAPSVLAMESVNVMNACAPVLMKAYFLETTVSYFLMKSDHVKS